MTGNRTLLLTLWTACSATLSAQNFAGGIRGLIHDPLDHVVAEAKVTLCNEATGTSRATLSNGLGEFVFSQVEPATYSGE